MEGWAPGAKGTGQADGQAGPTQGSALGPCPADWGSGRAQIPAQGGRDLTHSRGQRGQSFENSVPSSGTTSERRVNQATPETPSPQTGWNPELGDPAMGPLRLTSPAPGPSAQTLPQSPPPPTFQKDGTWKHTSDSSELFGVGPGTFQNKWSWQSGLQPQQGGGEGGGGSRWSRTCLGSLLSAGSGPGFDLHPFPLSPQPAPAQHGVLEG